MWVSFCGTSVYMYSVRIYSLNIFGIGVRVKVTSTASAIPSQSVCLELGLSASLDRCSYHQLRCNFSGIPALTTSLQESQTHHSIPLFVTLYHVSCILYSCVKFPYVFVNMFILHCSPTLPSDYTLEHNLCENRVSVAWQMLQEIILASLELVRSLLELPSKKRYGACKNSTDVFAKAVCISQAKLPWPISFEEAETWTLCMKKKHTVLSESTEKRLVDVSCASSLNDLCS